MRPLALVAILAALGGCSLNYQGKTFSAIEKPHHAAAGEEHKGAEHTAEEGSRSAADVLGDGEKPVEAATTPSRAASAFPASAQPTGRPPEMEAAPSEAGPSSEPVHEK